MKKISAELLRERFQLEKHPENGSFIENNYEHKGTERAASGSIYYYVGPGEISKFHVIDCDEYWSYIAGSPLQVWQIDAEGQLLVSWLGIEEGCEPLLYLKQGTIFGSRHGKRAEEGTFLSCITVPRFDYKGFKLIEKEEILENYPQLRAFFEAIE